MYLEGVIKIFRCRMIEYFKSIQTEFKQNTFSGEVTSGAHKVKVKYEFMTQGQILI